MFKCCEKFPPLPLPPTLPPMISSRNFFQKCDELLNGFCTNRI